MRPLLFLALALPAACTDQAIIVGGLQEVAMLKAIPNRNLDLLFVIDNSNSMADKQAALAANFPRMIDVLSQIDGGLPELHLGVVTSDMGTSNGGGAPAPPVGILGQGGCAGTGDDGELVQSPSVTGRFITDLSDGEGGRARNYTGELRDVFGGLAQVGVHGCGFEQHLGAMRRALGNPVNAGFLRADANLAVVVLADEDDCSAHDGALFSSDTAVLGPLQSFRCFAHGVTCDESSTSLGPKTGCTPRLDGPVASTLPFIDALYATKPDPRMLMVAGIVGDPDLVVVEERTPPGGGTAIPALAHSCVGTDQSVADPAVRLASFLAAFSPRDTLRSICDADLASPLETIAASAKKLIGDPCLDTTRLADSSEVQPGIQPSCEVLDVRDAAPETASRLALCSSGAPDCFELVADAVACPATRDHLRVRVHRATAVTDDTWTHVRCEVSP